ncbi:hypothetical protein [Desulfothermobacter acidiphilus]|uniref:hypothetical protein n=1 Tax=Desulfothermobacter acidiphilus TaxID=1938353 RepID=UPI003F8B8337
MSGRSGVALLCVFLALAAFFFPGCGCKSRPQPVPPPGVAQKEDLPDPTELTRRVYASLEKGVYFEGKTTVEEAGTCVMTCKVRGWAGKDREGRFCSRVESWDGKGHRCIVWFRSGKEGRPAVLVLRDPNTGEARTTELSTKDGAAIYMYGGPPIFPNWGWYEVKDSEKVGSALCVVLERPNGFKAWVRPSDGLPLKAFAPYVKGRQAVFEATVMEAREVPPGTFDLPG